MKFAPFLILLILIPTAGVLAQASDDVDDVEFTAATILGNGWVSAAGTGWYDDVDITGVSLIRDSAESISLFIQMTAMQPTGGPQRGDMDLTIETHFSIDGNPYAAIFTEGLGAAGFWGGNLVRVLATENYPIAPLLIEELETGFQVSFPRQELRDGQGNIPGQGASLESVYVKAHADQIRAWECDPEEPVEPCGFKARDRYPDTGELTGFVLASEPGQIFGQFQVTNPNPTRVTNGAASTYIYTSQIKNNGDQTEVLTFSLDNAPPGWQVRMPPTTEVKGFETITISVAISTPFAHQHGTTTTAAVIATVASTKLTIPLNFSVEWIDPPQPAGHHNKLFIHYDQGKGNSGLNMDTVERSSGLGGQPNFFVNINTDQNGNPRYRAERDVPLWPGLLIGLDADLERNGIVSLGITSKLSGEFRMSGEIIYVPNPQEANPSPSRLFLVDQLVTIELGKNTLEAPILSLEASDLVPVNAPGNLIFNIGIETTVPPDSPYLTGPSTATSEFQLWPDESYLELPLLEFSEPLPNVPLQDYSLPIQVDGEAMVRRAPSSNAVFNLLIESEGTFETFVDGPYVFLTDGNRITLWTTVPESAIHGSAIDALVKVVDRESGRYGFTSVRVIVDEFATEDDTLPTDLTDGSIKKTPAPSVVVLIGLLSLLTFASRRRQ